MGTYDDNKFAEGNCMTCGFAPAKPWRLLNPDGTVRFGCVDAIHALHADAWHTAQAPMVEATRPTQ